MKHFTFALTVETSEPMDPANIRHAVEHRLQHCKHPPLSLLTSLDVTATPVSDEATGVEAATLVELVALKQRLADVTEALKYARRFLKPENVDIAFIDAALKH